MGDAHQYRRSLSPPTPSPRAGEGAKRPLRVLSEDEKNEIAHKRALIHTHLPDAVPFVKELHEFGMIDGWRSVISVTVYPERSNP